MELDEELEKDLTFRRFNVEKQDQIRQLVSYTTLLGLDGNDLISIGGRLNRISKTREIQKNRTLAQEQFVRLKEVWNGHHTNRRYVYATDSGVKYQIEIDHWLKVLISNLQNNKKKSIIIEPYEVGTGSKGKKYLIALNIYHGRIKIDF